jgi:hypothetical protein
LGRHNHRDDVLASDDPDHSGDSSDEPFGRAVRLLSSNDSVLLKAARRRAAEGHGEQSTHATPHTVYRSHADGRSRAAAYPAGASSIDPGPRLSTGSRDAERVAALPAALQRRNRMQQSIQTRIDPKIVSSLPTYDGSNKPTTLEKLCDAVVAAGSTKIEFILTNPYYLHEWHSARQSSDQPCRVAVIERARLCVCVGGSHFICNLS